jgi:hypothetical protein
MKTKQSLSSAFLVMHGIILMGLGLYFVFIRPPLLPEDPRFMKTSLAEIQAAIPGLLIWLRRVFGVMGGFMFTSGLLIAYIAAILFQGVTRGARSVVTLAGLTSIGWMAIVNILLDSDFKWLLLAFNIPWIAAVILSWRESELAQ